MVQRFKSRRATSRDEFMSLCGQHVKVKNTFLEVADSSATNSGSGTSSSTSTQQSAQSCPELWKTKTLGDDGYFLKQELQQHEEEQQQISNNNSNNSCSNDSNNNSSSTVEQEEQQEEEEQQRQKDLDRELEHNLALLEESEQEEQQQEQQQQQQQQQQEQRQRQQQEQQPQLQRQQEQQQQPQQQQTQEERLKSEPFQTQTSEHKMLEHEQQQQQQRQRQQQQHHHHHHQQQQQQQQQHHQHQHQYQAHEQAISSFYACPNGENLDQHYDTLDAFSPYDCHGLVQQMDVKTSDVWDSKVDMLSTTPSAQRCCLSLMGREFHSAEQLAPTFSFSRADAAAVGGSCGTVGGSCGTGGGTIGGTVATVGGSCGTVGGDAAAAVAQVESQDLAFHHRHFLLQSANTAMLSPVYFQEPQINCSNVPMATAPSSQDLITTPSDRRPQTLFNELQAHQQAPQAYVELQDLRFEKVENNASAQGYICSKAQDYHCSQAQDYHCSQAQDYHYSQAQDYHYHHSQDSQGLYCGQDKSESETSVPSIEIEPNISSEDNEESEGNAATPEEPAKESHDLKFAGQNTTQRRQQQESHSLKFAGQNTTQRRQQQQPSQQQQQQQQSLRAFEGRKKKSRTQSSKLKLWCHLFLDECMLEAGFDLNKKIIGHGGHNTKSIFEATGAKIRLRGRGSGHLECDRREAPVHLMVAITTEIGHEKSFQKAVRMTTDLLEIVAGKYVAFCEYRGSSRPTKQLFWLGEVSDLAKACIGGGDHRDLYETGSPVAPGVQPSDAVKAMPTDSQAKEKSVGGGSRSHHHYVRTSRNCWANRRTGK